jgi:hypothetical protein
MKRINEFKGYRMQTEFDQDKGSFVVRRHEDSVGPQGQFDDGADIEIRCSPEPDVAKRRHLLQTPASAPVKVSPVFGMASAKVCEARIMFDMVAAIGSRNVIKVAC